MSDGRRKLVRTRRPAQLGFKVGIECRSGLSESEFEALAARWFDVLCADSGFEPCGVDWPPTHLEVFVCRPSRSATEEDRSLIAQWLDRQAEVAHYRLEPSVGALRDRTLMDLDPNPFEERGCFAWVRWPEEETPTCLWAIQGWLYNNLSIYLRSQRDAEN